MGPAVRPNGANASAYTFLEDQRLLSGALAQEATSSSVKVRLRLQDLVSHRLAGAGACTDKKPLSHDFQTFS